MAFREPTVEIIGLTTIFGNISTEGAACNALLLVSLFDLWRCFFMFSHCFANSARVLKEQYERAVDPEVPVAEGSSEPLKVLVHNMSSYHFVDQIKEYSEQSFTDVYVCFVFIDLK
jgi:inosine-uridine nucleoside N-ribohydrolase